MKITFLGSSHGFCEKNRFQSATLIEVRGKSYLIDAGAPVEYQAETLGKDMTKIEAVFITHAHLDHVGNLSSVVAPFMRYRYNDKCTVFFPDEQIAQGFDAWMSATGVDIEKMKSIVKFDIIKQGVIFDDGNIKVTSRPTLHLSGGKRPAFGFLVDDGEKKVMFTGDLGMGFIDYREVTEGSFDLIVCEMAHADLCNTWQMLSESDTKKMIITHYNMPRLEGYEEIFGRFPFDIQLARDGMEVIV